MIETKWIDASKSPHFACIKTFMRLPNVQTAENIDFAVVGVPFDTASNFRTGSRFGPSAIRDMSVVLRAFNINLGINITDVLSGVDLGDINVIPGYIEESYQRIEEALQAIIAQDILPVCLGGDHSITLAELRAIAKKHGPVALLQFDAHLNTADTYMDKRYNHTTVFRRAWEEGLIDTKHSIQIGIRGSLDSSEDIKAAENIGFKVITANMVRELGIEEAGRQIRERIGRSKAFFSFDIDFVDPAYAPGTGAMEVGGFTSTEALQLVRQAKDIKFVGFELVEVLPAYDPAQITACLAGNIINEFLGITAVRKRSSINKSLEL